MEESHLAVIMNENHPFAEREELHMSELANEKFVFLGKNSSSSEYNYTREWCQRCGFEPNIVECFDHVGMVLMMVKSGFGITDFIRPGSNGSYDGTCDSASGQRTGILQWIVLAQRQSESGNAPVCRLLLQCSER